MKNRVYATDKAVLVGFGMTSNTTNDINDNHVYFSNIMFFTQDFVSISRPHPLASVGLLVFNISRMDVGENDQTGQKHPAKKI